jgi:tRNA-Thr(GGU) m(6)t(6)A37 methyltransferase TsaA
MNNFCCKPIGIVHSPFQSREDIDPERNRRSRGFLNVTGELEIFKKYEKGLKDISGFSHLIVLFVFHQAPGGRLFSKPPGERSVKGIFATRSPHHPNSIGLTVVKLLKRDGNIIKVSGLDMIEGTPVLDIKPYTTKDRIGSIRTGHMAKWKKLGRS